MAPFTNAHHGGAREPFDLSARIESELKTRIEDAIDHACLEAMVKGRETRGGQPPVADNTRDREEFMARVRDLLQRLRTELGAALSDEQRRRLGAAIVPPVGAIDAEVAAQVALARELPDYWQRFEAVRLRQSDARSGGGEPSSESAERSGGQSRGLLDRLLRRG